MNEETLGQRLRRLRTERGLSQEELARKAGIAARAQISRFEGGTRNPGPEALQSLANVLGVSLTYLISGTDEPEPVPAPALGSHFFIHGKPKGRHFFIHGKPKGRHAIQMFSRDAETIRKLARQHGLTTPELMSQILEYCLRNMEI